MAKISFTSAKELGISFSAVLRRFPLEMIFAALGAWAAIQATLLDHSFENAPWIRLIMCCNLGLVLSLAASTFAASLRTGPLIIWVLRVLVVAATAGFYVTLSEQLRNEDVFRFFLLTAAGHLLVSVAPFWERGNISSFWYYNKSLFLRFLTAVLYSGVLFAGLAIALLAMDELFDLNIPGERYFQLWILIAAMVNTAIFLSGIPERPLQTEARYPQSLKVFTQYILIPLVSVYVLILLAYELKIVVQWDLPRGWVSNLIIGFAIAGILSLLLVYPVRNTSENKWIVWYARIFHWLLLPLLVLLFIAIGTRLADYGFTESRFIVLATGIWLLFTTAYFLLGRRENIKMIPASLILFTLLTFALASPVSLSSQQKRMLAIFDRNQLLESTRTGTVQVRTANQELPRDDRAELTSIVSHLYETYGPEAFQDYFERLPQPQDDQKMYAWEFTDSLLASVGTRAAFTRFRTEAERGPERINIVVSPSYALPTSGFDYLVSFQDFTKTEAGGKRRQEAGKHLIQEYFNAGELRINLSIDDHDSLQFNLRPLLSGLAKRHIDRGDYNLILEPEEVSLESETDQYRVRLFLTEILATAEVNEGKDSVRLDEVMLKTRYLLDFKN